MTKATAYDAGVLAFMLGRAGVREMKGYKDQTDRLIDLTMSCNRQEAIGWMMYYMAEALEKATGGRNDALRCQFLAAYDLRESLMKGGA